MSKLTIAEMIEQVPEGQARTFERSILEPGEERFLRVSQNWNYRPAGLDWFNRLPSEEAPWLGTRIKPRISVSVLPPPDVGFAGPAEEVVDFHLTGSHAYFISDKLFRLIEEMDPGSLEHVEFELQADDADLPFHAVMPRRVLEAIDTRRTTVRIQDQKLATLYVRSVRFPEGIVFDNDVLRGIASFSDLDAPAWYWSTALIAKAKSHGIRGITAASPASANRRVVENL